MTTQLLSRLMAPVAVLSILLLLASFGSAWYVRRMQRSVSDVMTNNVESVRAAQELEISIRETRTQFDRFLITLDKDHLEPVPRMRERTAEALTAVVKTATTPHEQTLIKRIRSGYDHFFAEYDEILRRPNRPLYTEIISLIDSVLVKEILDPAHEYRSLNEGMLTQNTLVNHELADRLTTGLIALGLCGSVGGLLGGTVIAVALRRTLLMSEKRLRTTAEQLDRAAYPGQPVHPNEIPGDTFERMSVSASAVLQRLRQTEKDALRAEQLAWVGQMAAGIAHEIRNPLMAIKLLVQAAAERREQTSFRSQDLRVLEEEIVRLEQIVSGFLDFSRPPRLEARPVDVRSLAEQVARGVQARAQLQGVELTIEPTTGPSVASVDPNQLRQVFFNLLFNALDAQPLGGRIGIRIDVNSDAEGYPEMMVAVEDAGPGLPADLADRVFEPFVSTKETGLGLGLSICRRIAENHGGNLTASSKSTGGTVFTLRLPLIRPNGIALKTRNN